MRSRGNPGASWSRRQKAILYTFLCVGLALLPLSMVVANLKPEPDVFLSSESMRARRELDRNGKPMPFAALKVKSSATAGSIPPRLQVAQYRWLGPFGIEIGTAVTLADDDIVSVQQDTNEGALLAATAATFVATFLVCVAGVRLGARLSPTRNDG